MEKYLFNDVCEKVIMTKGMKTVCGFWITQTFIYTDLDQSNAYVTNLSGVDDQHSAQSTRIASLMEQNTLQKTQLIRHLGSNIFQGWAAVF